MKKSNIKNILIFVASYLLCTYAFAKTPINNALETLKKIEAKLAQASTNQEAVTEQQRIASGEFLILSLNLNRNYLGEITAIKSEQSILISLSDLFDILQLTMTVDVNARSATGYNAEQQVLQLEAANTPAFFYTPTNKYPLLAQEITVDDDIYIDIKPLQAILNLEFLINYANLELFVNSQKPLPIEQQQARRDRTLRKNSKKGPPTLPWKASPYQAISSPVADLQLNYTADEDQSRASYSLLGTQDFAYLSAEYFLSGQNENLLTDSRLTFTKRNLNKEQHVGFTPSEITFGDVIATQVGGNYSSQYGRGIKVSNNTLNKNIVNNQINLSGAIQLGWDIELYRNEILIDQQLSLADGRYIFENIDLLYGENNFELIMYGPQGQVERKSEYYFVDSNQLAQGQGVYEVSVIEQGKQLLNNNAADPNNTGWQLAGRYEQGLTNNIAFYAGALGQNTPDNDLFHYSVGANISLFNRLLINTHFEENNEQTQEFEFTARTQLAEQSLLFRAQKRSDEQQDATNYQFNMAGGLMNNRYGRLSYQNNVFYEQSDNDDPFKQVRNQLSYAHSGFALSNQLQWQQSEQTQSTFGTTRFQKRFGRLSTRFSVDYSLSPVSEIVSYDAQFNRSLGRSLQGELTLRDSLTSDIQSAELGLNWQSDKLSLTSNVNYNSNDEWRLGLYSRFSLGFDVKNNQYFISKRTLTNTGSLMVRVFLDANNNGILDDDEQGVAGIKVKGVHNYRQAITDEQGIALITSMPANRTTDIILDKNSFEDPFLVPANDGFSVTPRAGFIEYMDYPLNNASEVEGVVYQQQNTKTQIQPFATVALLDKNDKKVAQTQAAYDGYYLFTDLKPGQYKAVVDTDYKNRKALTSTQAVTVDLSAQGDVLVGVDLTLKALESVNGSIANAGSFTSLNILKTYFRLISARINAKQAFYIHDKKQNKYILALAYNKSPSAELDTLCTLLISKGLKCVVEQYEILH
jgi:hypothetical protein